MLRRTGWVCRACAASAHPLPRVQLVQSLQLSGFPQLARRLQTLQAASATTSAPPKRAPTTLYSRRAPPRPRPSARRDRQAQKSLKATDTPGAPFIDQRRNEWQLQSPEQRFKIMAPYLAVRAEATKQTFQEVAKRFNSWDRGFQDAFKRLESSDPLQPSAQKAKNVSDAKRLLKHEHLEGMRGAWFSRPEEVRKRIWDRMMIATMHFYPERAAQVLAATLEPDVTMESYHVEDVLTFVARWWRHQPADSRQELRAALPTTFLRILQRTVNKPGYCRYHQWVLGSIFALSTPQVTAEIYEALRQHKHPLHWNTKVQVAARLAPELHFKTKATSLLEEAVRESGLHNDRPAFASVVSTLLSVPEGWEKGRVSREHLQVLPQIYARLVRAGFSTNLLTQTVLIRALCLTHQMDSAWKVYDVMREQRVIPDVHVYSILMNGAKLAGSLESTVRVLEEASPEAMRNPYIWNDLIHTVYKAAIAEIESRGSHAQHRLLVVPAFDSMLQVYAKFFRLAPLQKLIPLDLQPLLAPHDPAGAMDWVWKQKLALVLDRLPVSPPDELLEPGADTLGLMLQGYLKGVSDSSPVFAFYHNFRALVKQRDPHAIALLNNSTLPYDATIESLARFPGLLGAAVSIVSTMLQDAGASAAALKDASPRGLVPLPIARDSAEAETKPDSGAPPTTPQPLSTPNQKVTTPTTTLTPSPFRHPAPSVYTWNILLHAFLTLRRVKHGWHIMALMRKYGVPRTRATFNTLIAGSARGQDVKRTMSAIRLLERYQFVPDEFTQRGVALLAGHETALAHMEGKIEERVGRLRAMAEERRMRARERRREGRERAREEVAAAAVAGKEGRRVEGKVERGVVGEGGASGLPAEEESEEELAAALAWKRLETAADNALRLNMEIKRMRGPNWSGDAAAGSPGAVAGEEGGGEEEEGAFAEDEVTDAEQANRAMYDMYDELIFQQMRHDLQGVRSTAYKLDAESKAGQGPARHVLDEEPLRSEPRKGGGAA